MQRQYILVRKLLRNIKEITQRAHGVKKTLYWRRCDVITSHRRQSDVVSTSWACWGMDGTNSRPACGSYTETKTVYVFWPCSLLVVRCRRYIINGPRIYFCCFFIFDWSYWRKYVHEVLVNRLGGLSLPRKSVVRLTDRPDMTLDVYRGRKTTNHHHHHHHHHQHHHLGLKRIRYGLRERDFYHQLASCILQHQAADWTIKSNDPAHLTSWYLHEMDGDDGWYLRFNDS